MAIHETSDPGQAATDAVHAAPAYAEFVADALMRQVADLGRTWARRGADAVGATRSPDAPDRVVTDAQPAEEIVRTLAVAAAEGRQWHEKAMRAGWEAGENAVQRGNSLTQLLKELDGGVTLVLSAVDGATRAYTGPATALDGLALARRVADAASFLRLAAAGGFTRGMVDALRTRYRIIRHDLRNPLGTITTVVALMDDESIPEATRQHPGMRAMVARNARSMEAMIATTLGDPATLLPTIAMQATSIRDVACAVKGDLGAAMGGIDVHVGDALPTFPFDSAGLELLLKAVVIAMARGADPAGGVSIEIAGLAPGRASLAVHGGNCRREAGGPDVDVTFARELAARLGGQVTVHAPDHVVIDIPVETMEGATDRSGNGGPRPVHGSAGEARHDVAGQRERTNGVTSLL